MNRKTLFVSAVSVLVILVFSTVLLQEDQNGRESLNITGSQDEIKTTSEGVKYTVDPERLVEGCPAMDCIPSIDDPEFESSDNADEWLESGDRIIGVEINNESRAYPLKILSRHEIVNDRFGDEPVVVTYCPLCRSGVTYSREIGNETLEFGVSGKLLDANLVMYDRSTESYWNQIQGEAIIGPRTGQKLDLKFSTITEWQEWRNGHPDTEVLSRNTGIYPVESYSRNPYADYNQTERVGFGVGDVDDRLDSKEIVFGITVNNESKAYPEEVVESENIIQDSLGGTAVVVIERPDDGGIAAYSREVDGQTLDLELENEGMRDSNGIMWNFDGKEIQGERKIEKLNPKGFYWFAWSKFRPETEVYQQ